VLVLTCFVKLVAISITVLAGFRGAAQTGLAHD